MKRLAIVMVLLGCGATAAPPSAVVAKGVDVGRSAIANALMVAQDAVTVTQQVCQVDPTGNPCNLLVDALNKFYFAAILAEDAINKGADSEATVDALEAQAHKLLNSAIAVVRSRA